MCSKFQQRQHTRESSYIHLQKTAQPALGSRDISRVCSQIVNIELVKRQNKRRKYIDCVNKIFAIRNPYYKTYIPFIWRSLNGWSFKTIFTLMIRMDKRGLRPDWLIRLGHTYNQNNYYEKHQKLTTKKNV